MMQMLRYEVLGKERFDPAFREYIKAWAFKHPTPADFFRMMRDESGMDLD
jgi:aminopeptidase N